MPGHHQPPLCFVPCQPIFAMPMTCPPPPHHDDPPNCCGSCEKYRDGGGKHHGASGGHYGASDGQHGSSGRHHGSSCGHQEKNDTHHGGSGRRHSSCICSGTVPTGLPSPHNGNVGHRNAIGQRNDNCFTCGRGSAKEAVHKISRPERPSDYGQPGSMSNPGAGCRGPPCIMRGPCPPPCQPQFPPMLPCCTTNCPPGPCPPPGTSLLVGKDPPEPWCQPCCGKPPGCPPASEFRSGNCGNCEPCLWPPLCLR